MLSQAYLHRGKVFTEKKDFERALTDFTKAIEVEQTLTEAYLERAKLYEKKGEKDKAAADRLKVSELSNKTKDSTKR